jgi:hypothetical protein
VSDQDFFFDEEDEKPAAAKKPAAKTPADKTPAKTGSKPAAKPAAAKTAAAKTTGAKPAAKAAEPESGDVPFLDQTVTMAIAALAVVCALLLGVVLGILVGQSRASSLADSTAVVAPATAGGSNAAPLTQQQLSSGQLPAGHPSLSSTATSATGK